MPFNIPVITQINFYIQTFQFYIPDFLTILACEKEKQNTIEKRILAVFNHKLRADLNAYRQYIFSLKCLRNKWKQYLTTWKKGALPSLGNKLTGRDERRIFKCTFIAPGFYKTLYFFKW